MIGLYPNQKPITTWPAHIYCSVFKDQVTRQLLAWVAAACFCCLFSLACFLLPVKNKMFAWKAFVAVDFVCHQQREMNIV
jgi:hypothetical protein